MIARGIWDYGMEIYCYMEWKYIAIWNGNILLYGMEVYCYMGWNIGNLLDL